MTEVEVVVKKRGDRKLFGSVSCENVGSNILRKAKNIFRYVCLSVLPLLCPSEWKNSTPT